MAAGPSLAESAVARPVMGGWRQPVLLALGTVLALRVILSVWAVVVQATMLPAPNASLPIAEDVFTPQAGGLAAPWEREDAVWYEKIALRGYRPNDGSTAFFPLLPGIMRVAGVLTGGNIALAGLLVAALAAVAALALLYRLAAQDADPATAARAVAYLALFPTAFFLIATFTESLFLALILGAFWCARQRQWLAVAALAALAGLTKAQGGLMGLPLALEYLLVTGWRPTLAVRRGARPPVTLTGWRPTLTPRRVGELALVTLPSFAATGAYFAFLAWVVGDPLPWATRVSLMWQQRATWPGETLWVAVQKVISEGRLSVNTVDLAVLLLFTVLTLGAFRLRLSYGVQATIILLTTWLHVRADFPLASVSRYVLVAFPCFIVLALWAGRRPRFVHLLIIALWVSWLLVLASQVVRGYWVA